jgi:hypothetical protein
MLRRPKTTQELTENEAAVLDGVYVRYARKKLPTNWDDRQISARKEEIIKP